MAMHFPGVILATCALAGLAMAASIARAGGPATRAVDGPDARLKPEEVVRIVIESLAGNDANDNGIKTTWKFASPGNKSMTGPLERFIPLVKNPLYQPMLHPAVAKYDPPLVRGDHAEQLVRLTGPDGQPVYYLFQLSRQTDDGPLKNCWMTDGVVRVQPKQPDDLPDGQSAV